MKAKVRKSSPFTVVTSCGGAEFRKDQYFPVPEGYEDEARVNPYLEVAEDEAQVSTPLTEPVSAPAPPSDEGEIDATDSALAIAAKKGVDLSKVEGTGAGGRIIKADVVLYAESLKEE